MTRTLAALLVVVCLVGKASAKDQTLLLEVVINGYSTRKIGEFVLRDGGLYAKQQELEGVGVRVPRSVSGTREGLVNVSDLPGVTARLDHASQTLHVTARPERLMPDVLQAPGGPSKGLVESNWGATVNYDVIGSAVGGGDLAIWPLNQSLGSGLFDVRVFSPYGVLSSSMLGYLGASPTGMGDYGVVRLDSTYTYFDYEDLVRYRAGDFITAALPWTRAVRLGGAQVSRDFGVRPDLITFPLPSAAGAVAVPSTVEVLVNNTRVLSRNVQPGPFEVPQLPVITGAGSVTMSVTDAVGRQIVTHTPFYASSSLLRQGLDSFSFEAGLVRLNYGSSNNEYSTMAGAGTYRRGLFDWLTVEAHAEGTSRLGLGGLGLGVNMADLAAVNLAAEVSSQAGQTGMQLSAGVQRIGRPWSFAAFATYASPGFADIAAVNGQPVPQLQINATAGLALGEYGSLTAAYNVLNTPAGSVQPFSLVGSMSSLQPAQNTRLLSGTYTVQLMDMVSFYATAYNDFSGTAGQGVLVGMTMPLGHRRTASVSGSATSSDLNAQVQLTQTSVALGDWGYRLSAGRSRSNAGHEFAEVQYRSPWALLTAGADRNGGQTTLRAGARGALSLIGGGLFASNRINDSFAVVDTNGFKDVRVQRENREYGRTNSNGQLLVPDLRAFDLNHLSIDPTDIPPDATIEYTKREVRPQDRSGVVVHFPIKTSRGALVQLIDEAGHLIPAGSVATLKSSGVGSPVGYDGKVYLVDLKLHNELTIERRNGVRCFAAFNYHAKPGDIPAIGPVRCHERAR